MWAIELPTQTHRECPEQLTVRCLQMPTTSTIFRECNESLPPGEGTQVPSTSFIISSSLRDTPKCDWGVNKKQRQREQLKKQSYSSKGRNQQRSDMGGKTDRATLTKRVR
uniref:Uncharacterized protein n=1 Tax=Trypanosoma congolense (strain IL3000) TaxID=1068625 RepID=G0V0P7_TRYCI|nr:hypothetical protein, unlikely [Trypanosoma congolense IL3000]